VSGSRRWPDTSGARTKVAVRSGRGEGRRRPAGVRRCRDGGGRSGAGNWTRTRIGIGPGLEQGRMVDSTRICWACGMDDGGRTGLGLGCESGCG